MNKVVTINLNGSAFQLEEAAYDALRAYLDNAARQLAANPDRDEIVADIEQAIGDKCRAATSPHKNVVLAREVERIISEMGPIDDGSPAKDTDTSAASASGAADPASSRAKPDSTFAGSAPHAGAASSASDASGQSGNVRRLYRIYEGAMLSGVCNGLAVYFGIDPTLVRVLFVLAACLTLGGAALAYLALALLLPTARTPEEKAAAHGTPSTAQEFIRRAREGYYEAAKKFGDKHAHREWKRKFRHEMRTWRTQFRQNMAQQSAAWRPSWQSSATTSPPPPANADWSLWAAAPFAAIFKAVLTLLAVFAVISLLASGRLFTFALPAGVPVWVAIVAVFIVYQIVAAPFHAMRHAYRCGGWHPVHPLTALCSFFGSVFGVLLLVFTVWYLDRHVPDAHEFFRKIPPALHALLDALRTWWASL